MFFIFKSVNITVPFESFRELFDIIRFCYKLDEENGFKINDFGQSTKHENLIKMCKNLGRARHTVYIYEAK